MWEHGTKTTPVFLPADGEASWLLLPSSVSLLSGGTVQPENTYSCILHVTGQVWESQKRISITLITATISIHLPKPVSTDLTIKPDSVLTNPILSTSIETLLIKLLSSFCTSSIEPLGSKVSTTIKCSVSLPDNEASRRNNGRATPYLIKRHFWKSQYSKCYFGVLKKTVKLMGQSEDSHHFL